MIWMEVTNDTRYMCTTCLEHCQLSAANKIHIAIVVSCLSLCHWLCIVHSLLTVVCFVRLILMLTVASLLQWIYVFQHKMVRPKVLDAI